MNAKNFLICLFLLILLQTIRAAAPGSPDPTFGTGGVVMTSINDGSSGNDVTIQPDGKIIVVGWVTSLELNNVQFALVRYNPNGSPDNSFGIGGIVTTNFFNCDSANAVAVQTDGKIIVGGSADVCGPEGLPFFALARFNPDGSLDKSFGNNGHVSHRARDSVITDLALQTDGKIVAVGGDTIRRYNKDGSLDGSFGANYLGEVGASSLIIQDDRKIVIAGTTGYLFGSDFYLVRLDPDGSFDPTFGTGGIVTTDLGFSDRISDIAVQSDGKIVASGITSTTQDDFILARYNPDGSPDNSFGSRGIVWGGQNLPAGTAVQTDGRIITVGRHSFDMWINRRLSNGSPDPSFGTGGNVIIPITNYSSASSVAIQPDGKIVAAGNRHLSLISSVGYSFAVVRLDPEATRTNFDFDGDGRADVSVFRPSDRIWYLDRSSAGIYATQFGLSTDKLTPADYDGDGKTDISVYRDGTWYRLDSSDQSFHAVQFGLAGDIPVPADYTGDGRDDPAVYRDGVWWMLDLTNGQVSVVQFGLSTDKPVPADYDGDGKADRVVYRGGIWHLNGSTTGYSVVQFGLSTDRPVPADYDGDGKADPAVYRDGTWYLLRSGQGLKTFQFGVSTDIPVPADYDGDGRTDAAVFRDGIWYELQSTNGIVIQQFGLAADRPVPAAGR